MSVLDPVELTLYRQLFDSLCSEMGRTLQRGSYSPNIKERRDFSCALFDAAGRMVAQGRDIPVHLGSMPASVQAAVVAQRFEPGDVVMLNDPYCGGTHLPDITAVSAYFSPGGSIPAAFVANRAHHADVGGMSVGSLPMAFELYQEGLVIPPVKVMRRGRLQSDIVAMICANSRTPGERRGDLLAQLAALKRGTTRIAELEASLTARGDGMGLAEVFGSLIDTSATAARALIADLPDSVGTGAVNLEVARGSCNIRVTVTKANDWLEFDFSATDPQQPAPFNAVRAITTSAVFYVLRCLLPAAVPTTSGLLDAVRIVTKPGTLVDALPPAAVAAGNVETSQRIVQAVLEALRGLLPERIPAASQGTMNNLLVGASRPGGPAFTYYETIAGGNGASAGRPGLTARHSHMTNSLNTPVEALEYAYPLRVGCCSVRRGSGGNGVQQGGDGVVREIEFLTDCEFTLLRQSCCSGPPGSAGGRPGQEGRAVLIENGSAELLPASCTCAVSAGSSLRIETPGGGGWGKH
jgi:N-methylhydantoinase B